MGGINGWPDYAQETQNNTHCYRCQGTVPRHQLRPSSSLHRVPPIFQIQPELRTDVQH